ncbi:hypothetical protein GOP47_0018103 [Adiantum capillus-veneris]|uniref:HMA domain-containing protein n=1 Tax=Adiantum capillus-veneris TaxID=13818 RepID=A0A9D4UGW5_ADICA|nr:hypothetical protein GOP47_0018103 [Adiantum capillus-veneris]
MAEVVELRVRLDCSGCERKVRQALFKLKGVENVDIDVKQGKVIVSGYVERKKVLKAVRKAGKSAELIMPTSIAGYNPYLKESEKFEKTYNYRKHGYNALPGAIQNPSSLISKDGIAGFFSDENAHACSIM